MGRFNLEISLSWLYLLSLCYARAVNPASEFAAVSRSDNGLNFKRYTRRLQKQEIQSIVAAPISAAVSQYWEGNDGPWSSFVLQVGKRPQEVRVLPSTASSSTWVVLEDPGCNDVPIANCPASRGKTFNSSISATWESNLQWSIYELGVDEQLRDWEVNGDYGYDTVTLGHSGGGGPSVRSVVAGIGDTHFTWLGALGLNPRPVNFTDRPGAVFTSLVQQLKNQSNISSLSWGYTAGAKYQPNPVFGSLTFGGYDESRFKIPSETHSNLTFPFYTDIERDLTVGISSITTTKTLSSSSPAKLLSDGIYALIDSTVAQLWLPKDVCSEFESAFGLHWDADTELYKISVAEHDKLVALNPSVTFNITPSLASSASNQSVALTFPYSAFDLNVSWPYGNGPYKNESAYYFPLKRANDTNQYTLGRTFLQEAYVIADYERQNFSVWPCKWDEGTTKEKLVPILALNNAKQTTSGLGTGAIAGIAVGGAAGLIILGLTIWWYLRRKSRTRVAAMGLQQIESGTSVTASPHTSPLPKKSALVTELAGTEKYELRENNRFEVEPGGKFEMDGAGLPHEADGRGKLLIHEMDAGGDGVGLVDLRGQLVRITVEPPTALSPRPNSVLPSPVSAKAISSSKSSAVATGEADEIEIQRSKKTHQVAGDFEKEPVSEEKVKDEKDGVRSFFGFLKAFRASGRN